MAAAVMRQGAQASQTSVGGIVVAAARSPAALPAWGTLVLALGMLGVRSVMQQMRVQLLEGEYPPPRNMS